MEPTPANMQSFETVQSVLLWAQLKGDSLQASLNIWVLKLMIILLFRELLGRCNREVVCACQACDAGSKAKTVVASGAASLDMYSPTLASSFSSFQCAEFVDYEPVFGGPRFSVRASGTQDPRRLILSCALHCLFCGSRNCLVVPSLPSKLLSLFFEVPGSALASVSAAAFMLLCAATAGAFGTAVVCALPFDLADGGFMRMSVFVTLIVSADVFTLVDFYFHFAGLQPAFEEPQQQAAAAGGHYASEAQATPRVDVGDPPVASCFHLCGVSSCVTS